ncbi:hypothetical protein ACS2B2_25760 [Bacillus cereus group sp. BceL297]|uniref:hypothetical protein n=1 Tax=unclassified Bacillus cereus group TaxID=2750818 RepID=UPI003F2238AE
MGNLLKDFLDKYESDSLVQKAVRGLLNGYSEDLVQRILEINDEEVERAKELYEQMKKEQKIL